MGSRAKAGSCEALPAVADLCHVCGQCNQISLKLLRRYSTQRCTWHALVLAPQILANHPFAAELSWAIVAAA